MISRSVLKRLVHMRGEDMNKVLICEGKCNPALRALDATIQEAGLPSEGTVDAPPREVLEDLHALKHTVHVSVSGGASGGVYACVECGAERRF